MRAVSGVEDQARLRAAIAGIPRPEQPDQAAAAYAVRPFRWLLDQAGVDGIPLTGAGYLPAGSITDRFEQQAGLLLLIGIAAGWDDLDAAVARWLGALGWLVDSGPVTPSDAYRAALGTRTVLEHLGAIERPPGGTDQVTDLGAAFARTAAWTWP